MTKLLLYFFGVIGFLIPTNLALAESANFELDQTNFLLQTSTAKDVTETLLVKNLTDKPITVELNWTTGQLDSQRSLDFAKIQNPQLSIEPYSVGSSEILFTIPESLQPGDYYGGVFVNDGETSQAASITLRLLGQLKESVILKDFQVSGNKLQVSFENQGNISTDVSGKIKVTNPFNQKILEAEITQFSLKASSTDTKEFVISSKIPGPHQAKIEYFFGAKAVNQTKLESFWQGNLSLVIILITVLISLLSIIFLRRKSV